MSDVEQITLQEAINLQSGSGPEEEGQTEPTQAQEEDLNPEAEDLSESLNEADGQTEEGDELETDPEVDEDGETVDDDDNQDEDEAEPMFTVTVDGKEFEVNQQELLQGYSRTKDYQNKTAALAEQRRAVQAKGEDVEKLIADLKGERDHLQEVALGNPPQRPDPNLFYTDREAFEQARLAYDTYQENAKEWEQYRAKRETEIDEKRKADWSEMAQAEAQQFVTHFDIKDEVGLTAKVGQIHQYLASLGIPQEQLAQMVNHKAYIVADKARQFDEIMAGKKAKVTKKVPKAKIKPVSTQATARQPKPKNVLKKAHQRIAQANQVGSQKDAIEAGIDSLLGEPRS